MTIVVGDEITDRLLFWGAQHRYPALSGFNDIPILRLSPKRFQNGAPAWLKNWIAVRNHRHLSGNQAPRTVLRSCSLQKEQLDEIAAFLRDNCMVMVSSEHYADPCVFETGENWISENRNGPYAKFVSTWSDSGENKKLSICFQDNQFELPLVQPWHLRDVATANLAGGVWAVDLCIERAEDHSLIRQSEACMEVATPLAAGASNKI